VHYALGTFAFALALLSKPSAVVVPGLIAVIALLIRRRSLRSLWPLFPWLLMCIPIAMITRAVQAAPMADVPLTHRIPVALDALAFYIAKIFWPANVIPDYGRTPAWLFAHSAVHYTFLLPIAIAGICLLGWRKFPWLSAGMILFALGVLPVLGLTPFVYQKYSTVADRYVYLSMLGPALIAAFFASRLPRAAIVMIAITVSVPLAILTIHYTSYWKDTPTLFEHTLAINPDSFAAHDALAHWYTLRGNPQQSLEHDRAALRTHPRYGRVLYNMGNTLTRLGDFPQAIAAYQAAATNSDLSTARKAAAYDNMGIAYLRNGDLSHVPPEDLTHAAESFRQALALQPSYHAARQHLEKLEGYLHLRPLPPARAP
jgi:hypothetical protein